MLILSVPPTQTLSVLPDALTLTVFHVPVVYVLVASTVRCPLTHFCSRTVPQGAGLRRLHGVLK